LTQQLRDEERAAVAAAAATAAAAGGVHAGRSAQQREHEDRWDHYR